MAKDGLIYIAKCEDRYKIGWTQQNADKRIAGLRTGNPFPIELIGTIPGSMTDESDLHNLFASKRITGEWFLLDVEDVDYILSLAPEPEPRKPIDFDALIESLSKASPAQQRAFVRAVKKISKAS